MPKEQHPIASLPNENLGNVLCWIALAIVLPLVLCQAGCRPVMPDGKVQSPLKPASLSQDSLVLDIFFIRFPFGDEQADNALWEEIDEQHFPPECRRRLSENGFRVGRIGGSVPVELSKLLELGEKPVAGGEPAKLALDELDGGPRVRRRHLQIQPRRRIEIMASDEYDELPVITKDDSGQVSGKFFKKAQPMLALRAELESDGRVNLSVTPEVHHGQSRMKVKAGTQGVMQLDSSRGREVFDTLASRATLAPGDMYVVSVLPDHSGSLGHHFFTETNSGKLEQKLIVIRLSQTQHDDLFGE